MTFQPSGRKQVERLAKSLRRGWLRRRNIKLRDLPPAVTDALTRWSEAEARLRLADDQVFDRWTLAAQNSAARLAARLEELSASASPSPEEEMRALLTEWMEPPADEAEDEPTDETDVVEEASLSLKSEEETEDSPIDFEYLEAHSAPVEPPQEPYRPKEPVSPLAWHSKKHRQGFVDINQW
jgi:hypothetical protein